MLTYKGLGYSAAFVANMNQVIDRIGQGAAVTVVNGPDDICNGMTDACRATSGHDCALTDTNELDLHALLQVTTLLGRSLDGPILLHDIRQLRSAFHAGTIRAACVGCPWHEICDQIAADDFAGARL